MMVATTETTGDRTSPIKYITEIVKTCSACPEQYEGTLNTGERFYLRCRFGVGELRVGSQEQFDNWTLVTVAEKNYGEGEEYKGEFQEGDIAELMAQAGIYYNSSTVTVDDQCEAKARKVLGEFIEAAEREAKRKDEIVREDEEAEFEGPETDMTVFVTLDEDIKKGKITPGAMQMLMEQAEKVAKEHNGPLLINKFDLKEGKDNDNTE